jgi:hypothetical protein
MKYGLLFTLAIRISSGFTIDRDPAPAPNPTVAAAGKLIYPLRVKNITSAPRHTNAKAAIIPTVGDHIADRITRASSISRVKGRAYISTRLSGYAVSI